MEHGCISLAGIPIGVSCQYPCTIDFCRDYACDDAPAFTVEISPADIDAERARCAEEGNRFSETYLETLALYWKICDRLADHGVFLMHSSAIAVDGKAYLFAAKSGTGKSTHARLWREVLPSLGHTVCMVNDDKPLIRVTPQEILVCGTPWQGKHHLGENICVPVSAVGKICRSPENRVTSLEDSACWKLLIEQSYLPADPLRAGRVLQLLGEIRRRIRFCTICCDQKPEAALVSWAAMSDDKERNCT